MFETEFILDFKIKKMKNYRTNGAVGALLDEYEKALSELKEIIKTLTDKELSTIADAETKDEDCRSIQTILSHLVRAGYTYAIYIRNQQGENLEFRTKTKRQTAAKYIIDLEVMFAYT